MLATFLYALAALPALSFAQNVYTVTIGTEVTAFTLPPFTASPADTTPAAASPPPMSDYGAAYTTIPLTMGSAGPVYTVILPNWGATVPTGPGPAIVYGPTATVTAAASPTDTAAPVVSSTVTYVVAVSSETATATITATATGSGTTATATATATAVVPVVVTASTLSSNATSGVAAATGFSIITVAGPSGSPVATFTLPVFTNATSSPVPYTGVASSTKSSTVLLTFAVACLGMLFL